MPISHLLTASFYPTESDQSKGEQLFQYDRVEPQDIGHNSEYNYDFEKESLKSEHNSEEEQLLLIDTDGGTEDAWAIFMGLSAHQHSRRVKIVGITCVYGTTTVENACVNVSRILNTVNEKNVPVFKGMGTSMVSKFEHSDSARFNGIDGFGDSKLPRLNYNSVVEDEHAVNAIIKLAEMYKGKLSVVCLGPLTNIAMALKMKPEIANYMKEVFIVGGNTEGIGNVTACSEFNFYVDPEAASVVLESFSYCPIYIVPYETCLKSATSSYTWRLNSLGKMRTKEMDLLNKIEGKILDKYRDSWSVHDAIAMACFINPQVMKKTENFHCSVELHGNHTRGLMVVDRNFLMQKPANVILIEEVNISLYQKMLIWAAGGPSY